MIASSMLILLDGIPASLGAATATDSTGELFASFGAVHLNITSLDRSVNFWTRIAGLKLRSITSDRAELGTATTTLVVLHRAAGSAFREGYTGLYHVAIHAPDLAEFAHMLHRLNVNRYAYSPVDHIMSKSLYLRDPDGITIEFVAETPGQFKWVDTSRGGLQMEDADGRFHGPSDPLDVKAILRALQEEDTTRIVKEGTRIGHLHFYAGALEATNTFYKQIEFQQFNYLPDFLYADLSAGGPYKHRIALNNWHGKNKPVAPENHAGLRHFTINYHRQEKLDAALAKLKNYEKSDEGYLVKDPSGNSVMLGVR